MGSAARKESAADPFLITQYVILDMAEQNFRSGAGSDGWDLTAAL